MAKPKKFDLENPAPVADDENEETLAAIDEGMRDADAGRTVPAGEVRCRLHDLHFYQDALVRKGLEEMRSGRVANHDDVAKHFKKLGATPSSGPRPSASYNPEQAPAQPPTPLD